MSIKLTLAGDEALRRKLTDTAAIAEPARTMMRTIGRDAERVAKHGAPESVAKTIQSNVSGLSANVTSTHPAAVPIEAGRRPGAPLPPVEPIRAWALRKGITVSPFVLARAIARRGVRGRWFLRAARSHVENRLPRYLDDFARDVIKRWD